MMMGVILSQLLRSRLPGWLLAVVVAFTVAHSVHVLAAPVRGGNNSLPTDDGDHDDVLILPPWTTEFCEVCTDPASCSIGVQHRFGLDASQAREHADGGAGVLPSEQPLVLFPTTASSTAGSGTFTDEQAWAGILAEITHVFANTTRIEDLLGNTTVEWSSHSARIIKNRGEGDQRVPLKALLRQHHHQQQQQRQRRLYNHDNGSVRNRTNTGTIVDDSAALKTSQPWYLFDRDHFFGQLRREHHPVYVRTTCSTRPCLQYALQGIHARVPY